MALKATLHLVDANMKYSIVECEYEITQPVNADGQPNGGVKAGRIVVTIVSPEKAQVLQEWMLNDNKQHDGYIEMDVNYNRFGPNSCRYIEFKNTYCVGLYEYFNNQTSNMATMRLTLYAEFIAFLNSRNGYAVGYNNLAKEAFGPAS